MSTQAALIHGLAEGVHINSLLSTSSEDLRPEELSSVEHREPSMVEKWAAEFRDTLEVLLAERRVDEDLTILDEGECRVEDVEERTSQPSTCGSELRSAVLPLKKLGDGPCAHTLLLNSHNQRLQYNLQSLRPSSTSYGGAFTAALSHS
uniref:Uncharacterized protein n=1 Tax=Nelumbo nucifera TaxID=4432 RepID=A0A822YVX2_NELNU|nr:TPA_asm: hypothetical protein HUJ06_005536 [Nelumbo nucifera]